MCVIDAANDAAPDAAPDVNTFCIVVLYIDWQGSPDVMFTNIYILSPWATVAMDSANTLLAKLLKLLYTI